MKDSRRRKERRGWKRRGENGREEERINKMVIIRDVERRVL